MSAHSPRPPELPADPDKTFCGVRLSQAPAGNPRTLATAPRDVECDTCAFRLLRYAQSEGVALSPDRFPWEPPPTETLSPPPTETP